MEWDPVTEKEEGIRRETSGRRGCDTEKIMMKKDPFLSSIQNPVGLQLLGENHSDHGTSINIYAYIYIYVCVHDIDTCIHCIILHIQNRILFAHLEKILVKQRTCYHDTCAKRKTLNIKQNHAYGLSPIFGRQS